MVDDGSDEDKGLVHEVGLAIVRQMKDLVNIFVGATQSTFHAVKGSAENWATFSASLLQNVTEDMKDTLSMLCYLGILHSFMKCLPNLHLALIMKGISSTKCCA